MAVAQTGAMYARAVISGVEETAGVGVTVEPSVRTELKLECTPTSATRGETITCTASSEPASASLRVLEWRFEPQAGTGLPTVTLSEDVKVWVGPLAVGGTVTVSTLVEGATQTAAQAVAVTARDWSDKIMVPRVVDVTPGRLTDPPKDEHQLGNMNPKTQFSLPWVAIEQGPNTGYWYFADIPVQLRLEVSINTLALREGSEFWRNHPVVLQGHVIGTPTCTQQELLNHVLPKVRAHEGFSRSDANSHVQTWTDEFERRARAAFEPVVRSINDMRGFDEEIDEISAAAWSYSRGVTDLSSRNPLNLRCELNFSGQRH
jgi:hypothetical protein